MAICPMPNGDHAECQSALNTARRQTAEAIDAGIVNAATVDNIRILQLEGALEWAIRHMKRTCGNRDDCAVAAIDEDMLGRKVPIRRKTGKWAQISAPDSETPLP